MIDRNLTVGDKLYHVYGSFDPIAEKMKYYFTEYTIVQIEVTKYFKTILHLKKQNKYVNNDVVYITEEFEPNNAFLRDCYSDEDSAKNRIGYLMDTPMQYIVGWANKVK